MIVTIVLFLFTIFIGEQVIAISSSFVVGDSTTIVRQGACSYVLLRFAKRLGPGNFSFQRMRSVGIETANEA